MSLKPNSRKPMHRGAPNNFSAFGPMFIRARLAAFSKDMEICLRPMPAKDRPEDTHAYFPALQACFGLLEYLTGLYVGKLHGLADRDIQQYAKYLLQPDYNEDVIYVLHRAFRNSVAHRGIASGVWVDKKSGHQTRRLTWKLSEQIRRPAVQIVEENYFIKLDSPWECPYTHRAHIYLGQFWRDITASAVLFSDELAKEKTLQTNFGKCMLQLYPR